MVSAPTGPILYLYLDLFSSFALSALCVLCMNHSDPTGSSHVMIRMCSIFGIHTIVTMVCYGMCLSLKSSP